MVMVRLWIRCISQSGFCAVLLLTAINPTEFGIAQINQETDEARARGAAAQFVNAVTKAEGINIVMKNAGVPFFLEGKENVTDRDELATKLNRRLSFDPSPFDATFVAHSPMGLLPDGVFSPKDRELLSKITDKSDLIVFFRFQRTIIAVPIRVKDNRASVIGIRTGLTPLTMAILADYRDKKNEKSKKLRDEAKSIAEEFLKAAKEKNTKNLMALIDVPWYGNAEVIKDRAVLEKTLESSLSSQASKDRSLPSDIFVVTKYSAVRELIFEGQKLQTADQVFASDDWAVLMRDGKRVGRLFVRVKDGKGKVIGLGR